MLQFLCQTDELHWDKDNCLEFKSKSSLEWGGFSQGSFLKVTKFVICTKIFTLDPVFSSYTTLESNHFFHSAAESVLFGKNDPLSPIRVVGSWKHLQIRDGIKKAHLIV
jgi:hypothetical protein